MPSKTRSRTSSVPPCAVCKEASKYRCSSCSARYCSVPCYKIHKSEQCNGAGPSSSSSSVPLPLLEPNEPQTNADEILLDKEVERETEQEPEPTLKPLTAISWPPEPDSSIFTDPLRREDPKPLRHAELMRIATSPQLRHLLNTTSLSQILRIIDTIPSPTARSSTLSKLLGIDNDSLARPGESTLLSQRDSPPPLEELLEAVARGVDRQKGVNRDEGEAGWWLGRENTKEGRIWIGEEEKKLMRTWASVVCGAIDGNEGDAWGNGNLAWEV